MKTPDEIVKIIDAEIEKDTLNIDDNFKYIPMTVAQYKALRGENYLRRE